MTREAGPPETFIVQRTVEACAVIVVVVVVGKDGEVGLRSAASDAVVDGCPGRWYPWSAKRGEGGCECWCVEVSICSSFFFGRKILLCVREGNRRELNAIGRKGKKRRLDLGEH